MKLVGSDSEERYLSEVRMDKREREDRMFVPDLIYRAWTLLSPLLVTGGVVLVLLLWQWLIEV